MEQVFLADEVVYFDSFTELKEKALYYLAHKDEACAIAKPDTNAPIKIMTAKP